MEYIHSSDFSLKSTCVTLGKFDGLHVGHQKLMQELAKGKKEGGRKSVVFTFDFHPSMFLAKEAYKLISMCLFRIRLPEKQARWKRRTLSGRCL